MKSSITLLTIGTVATLLIIGCLCIRTATEPSSYFVAHEARTPSLIAGLVSFTFAVGLVAFAIIMTRKQP